MTEIEALEKTQQVWEYLSLHPHMEAHEVYQELNLPFDMYFCPLCDYCTEPGVLNCDICPMRDDWVKYTHGAGSNTCKAPGSVYLEWKKAVLPTFKAFYAGQISSLAECRASRLKREKAGEQPSYE